MRAPPPIVWCIWTVMWSCSQFSPYYRLGGGEWRTEFHSIYFTISIRSKSNAIMKWLRPPARNRLWPPTGKGGVAWIVQYISTLSLMIMMAQQWWWGGKSQSMVGEGETQHDQQQQQLCGRESGLFFTPKTESRVEKNHMNFNRTQVHRHAMLDHKLHWLLMWWW